MTLVRRSRPPSAIGLTSRSGENLSRVTSFDGEVRILGGDERSVEGFLAMVAGGRSPGSIPKPVGITGPPELSLRMRDGSVRAMWSFRGGEAFDGLRTTPVGGETWRLEDGPSGKGTGRSESTLPPRLRGGGTSS